MEEEKKTTKKQEKETNDKGYVEELEKKYAASQKQIGELNDKLNDILNRMQCAYTQPVLQVAAQNTDVTIVHLLNNEPGTGLSTVVTLNNGYIISATYLGEEITLSKEKFDDLVGAHRAVFDLGWFAVSDKCDEAARSKRLNKVSDLLFKLDDYKHLDKLNSQDLLTLYNHSPESLKESIISRFKMGCIKGDPAYFDTVKMAVLESVAPGCFDDIRKDIETRREKASLSERKNTK